MTTEAGIEDPRITEILGTYIDRYMAGFGPYVSCVFFALLFGFTEAKRAKKGYIKTMHVSVDEIARKSGISRRKAFDAIKTLKGYWIVVQLKRRGRGNKSRYYFLPAEKWVIPG